MTDTPPPTCTCSTAYSTREEFGQTITTRVHGDKCPVAIWSAVHDTKPPNVKRVGPT